MSFEEEQNETCALVDQWLSQMNVQCPCQKSDNCTYLPENGLYCGLAEAARRNCPHSCSECPIKG